MTAQNDQRLYTVMILCTVTWLWFFVGRLGLDSFHWKLGNNRERMARLGVTEMVMIKYYIQAGPGGQNNKQAFEELKEQFQLSEADAVFVKSVLDNCSPY